MISYLKKLKKNDLHKFNFSKQLCPQQIKYFFLQLRSFCDFLFILLINYILIYI